MIRSILILVMVAFCNAAMAETSDVYVVFYATAKGRTGHMGVAMDTYKVIYREVNNQSLADTVATGELVYYDLWPNDDEWSISKTGKNIAPVYFRLPVSTTEEITLNTLYDEGIPHREHYPCDGILQIQTEWEQDQWMMKFLDSMITMNRDFNARKFNCADFVRIPVERLLGVTLRSKEFIGTGWSTTPNKLYQRLRGNERVKVIKNADEKAQGSFLGQRVMYAVFHRRR
jgi:hypothetical protein